MNFPKIKQIYESVTDKNNLVGALKKGDIEGAKKALTNAVKNKRSTFTLAQEFGMDNQELRNVTDALSKNDIELAKKAMGISQMQLRGPDVDPKTGKIWGQNKQAAQPAREFTVQELDDFIKMIEWTGEQEMNDDLYETMVLLDKSFVMPKKGLNIEQFKNSNPKNYKSMIDFLDKYYDNKSELNLNERRFLENFYRKLEPEGWED